MNVLHSSLVARHHQEFLDDVRTSLLAHVQAAHTDSHQRAIFKICTAAHASLRAFGKDDEVLSLGAAGIARRCALLASIRQVSLVRVELRRAIECVLWDVYFIDHPVEFSAFLENGGATLVDDPKTPIETAACGPTRQYFAYAEERFRRHSEEFARDALNKLFASFATLSSEVHAARGVLHPSGSLAGAFDAYDGKVAARLEREIRTVLSAVVVLSASIKPARIGLLDGIERAWFDWLVGSPIAKAIRGGDFGIPRST